ncbi:MAG TPA: hypothetical protein VER04_22035 [Polyangiaceae bacterium]|nr:hypothetical protein [Polyangiaceae bacterium]
MRKYLNLVDDGSTTGQACRDLTRERALLLARHGAPEQYLTTTHHDADLGCVNVAVAMHLFLNTTAQLRICLAHPGALLGSVHACNGARHVPREKR